jgi:hypothetical protein
MHGGITTELPIRGILVRPDVLLGFMNKDVHMTVHHGAWRLALSFFVCKVAQQQAIVALQG